MPIQNVNVDLNVQAETPQGAVHNIEKLLASPASNCFGINGGKINTVPDEQMVHMVKARSVEAGPMHTEWEAWQLVVKQWQGDINDQSSNKLVAAIKLWGENLAALRLKQTPEIRAKAMWDAKEEVARKVG